MAYVHTILGQGIKWMDGEELRSGVVWSAGPLGGTVWVIPDVRGPEEGVAVCVRVAAGKEPEVTSADRTRSEASVQEWGMSCMANRFKLPKVLFPGRDRQGGYGYGVPRGA